MAKNSKISDSEAVDALFQKMNHPLKAVVQTLRELVLATDKEIGEHIKWNSPAFYYTGEMKPFDPKEYKRDIVVFNLHKKEFVLLVFPTGAKIEDASGLLEGSFPDSRKVIKFSSQDEVKAAADSLQTILKTWLSLVEK